VLVLDVLVAGDVVDDVERLARSTIDRRLMPERQLAARRTASVPRVSDTRNPLACLTPKRAFGVRHFSTDSCQTPGGR